MKSQHITNILLFLVAIALISIATTLHKNKTLSQHNKVSNYGNAVYMDEIPDIAELVENAGTPPTEGLSTFTPIHEIELTEEGVTSALLEWQKITHQGKIYQHPNTWWPEMKNINGVDILTASSMTSSQYPGRHYIAYGIPTDLQKDLEIQACVGDSEIATCAIGSSPEVLKVFEILTYFE